MTQRAALIFGIFGQDGSYMADLLLAKGYAVVGTSRDADRAASGRTGDVDVRSVDLGDKGAVAGLVAAVAPDEIYNFAAFSTGSGMYDAPVEIGNVNGLAVVRILQAMRHLTKPAKFCQASSSEMFAGSRTSPQNERTEFAPYSPYGAAKLYAHNMVGVARRHDGAFACSAILFNHESPRRPPTFVTRKITRAAAAIALGLETELVLGDLQARRDWSHASDIVQAMWLMLQADQPGDYVVASGQTHSVQDVCEVAFGHLGLDWRKHVRVDPGLQRQPERVQRVGDARLARERLGWTPRFSFKDIIKEMADADLRNQQAKAAGQRV